jgi:multiple sugar transport system substrate-binding protein
VKRTAFAARAGLALAMIAIPFAAGPQVRPAAAASVVHMVYFPGPESDAMAKVVAYWNQNLAAKNGFQVEMDLFDRLNSFDKENTFLAAHSASEDLIFTASYEVGSMANYLDPIGPGAPGPGGKVNPSLFIPSTVDSLKVNGKLYAIPMDVSNQFLYYRTDLITKLLHDPAEQALYTKLAVKYLHQHLVPKPPASWNWGDFEATAIFFTQKYNPASPTQYGTSLQLKNLIYNIMVWDDLLWSYGGSWTSHGKAALTSPAAAKAMAVYDDLYQLGCTPAASTNWEYPETNLALETGKAAMALQWSAAYHELTNPAQDPHYAHDVGIAPVPGPVHRTHVHALALALNKYSQNKVDAVTWLNFLGTKQAMDMYARAGGIPSVASVLSGLVSVHPESAEIARDVKEYGFAEPASANEPAILTALSNDLSGAWAGQTSATQALARANADVNKILAG